MVADDPVRTASPSNPNTYGPKGFPLAISSYDHLESAVRSWAEKQPAVQVILLVGSRARQINPADRYSDLDMILFADQPGLFTSNSAWLEEISRVWAVYQNTTGHGDIEWIVLFEGGFKADFVIVESQPTSPLEMNSHDLITQSQYQFVLQRGVRLLYSKSNLYPQDGMGLVEETARLTMHPDESEFRQLTSRGYLLLYQTVKMEQRGENWLAQAAFQGDFRRLTIRLFEWQASTVAKSDQWFGGRFLSSWADPDFKAEFESAFTVSAGDPLEAVLQVLPVFQGLLSVIAEKLGYDYPLDEDSQILAWLKELCQIQNR